MSIKNRIKTLDEILAGSADQKDKQQHNSDSSTRTNTGIGAATHGFHKTNHDKQAAIAANTANTTPCRAQHQPEASRKNHKNSRKKDVNGNHNNGSSANHSPTAKNARKAFTKAAHQALNTQSDDQESSLKHAQALATANTPMQAILQQTKPEALYQNDKQINRLRWLAFYYLSNRELSQQQLRQKLLDKDQDATLVAALLEEFAQKGYQSDERAAYMIIRESIRRGRGLRHIAQALKQAGIYLEQSLDELIENAGIDSLTDGTVIATDASRHNSTTGDTQDSVNWLLLAVEARCKKYGNTIPQTPKEKARQLRFLQYRGFSSSVCFDALKYTVDDLPL